MPKLGDYSEKRVIEALFSSGISFSERLKPNFEAILSKLGINDFNLTWQEKPDHLIYLYKDIVVAEVRTGGFVLYTEALSKLVDIQKILSKDITNIVLK